jgi:hypothetical protein
MAIMAVAVAVTFSAPAFAGEEKKDMKDEKKAPKMVQMINADEKKDEKKKDEKKGSYVDTFGDEKKDEKKKDEKGK